MRTPTRWQWPLTSSLSRIGYKHTHTRGGSHKSRRQQSPLHRSARVPLTARLLLRFLSRDTAMSPHRRNRHWKLPFFSPSLTPSPHNSYY